MIVTTLDWQPVEVQGNIALTTVWVPPVKYSKDDSFDAEFDAQTTGVQVVDDWYIFSWYHSAVNQNNGVLANNTAQITPINVTNWFLNPSFNIRQWMNGDALVFEMVKLPSWWYVVVGNLINEYQGNAVGKIFQVHADGRYDTDSSKFGVGITSTLSVSSQTRVGVLSDGSIIVVSASNITYKSVVYWKVIKILADGNIDTTFITNIWANVGAGVTTIWVVIMPDDTMFIYSSATTWNGASSPRLAKLLSTGAVDTSFTVGAWLSSFVRCGFTDWTYLYLGGAFTTWQWGTANRIVKLDMTWAIASGWVTVGAANGEVQSMSYNGSEMYIAWSFTTYESTPNARLAKISMTTGQPDAWFVFWTWLSGFSQNNGRVHALSDRVIVTHGNSTAVTWKWSATPIGICDISNTGDLLTTYQTWFATQFTTASFIDGNILFVFSSGVYNWLTSFNAKAVLWSVLLSLTWRDVVPLTRYTGQWRLYAKAPSYNLYATALITVYKVDDDWNPDLTYSWFSTGTGSIFWILPVTDDLCIMYWDFSQWKSVNKRGIVATQSNGSEHWTVSVWAWLSWTRVSHAIITSDNKLLIVGTFFWYKWVSSQNHIVRIDLSNWDRDATFTSYMTYSAAITLQYVIEDVDWTFRIAHNQSGNYKIIHVSTTGSAIAFSSPVFNNTITSMVLVDNYLYVVGTFTTVNGVTSQYFTVIDKTDWSVVYTSGTDFNGSITSITYDTDWLLFSGNFTIYQWEPALRALRIHI